MTALADESIDAAARSAHAQAVESLGRPRNDSRLIVAALGKLGGEELNVSSDVDLVFLYEEDGETDRPRPASHAELYAAWASA
jgi:Glutamine synthetase adenylyltransferase